MSKWIIKTAVQRVISWMPQSHKVNAFFQRHITNGLDLDRESFEAKLDCCRTHMEYYRRFSPSPKDDFTVLELGTGWWPILPIGMRLCGSGEIWTFDICPLLRRDTFSSVVQAFCDYDRDGNLKKFLPDVRLERMAQLREALDRAKHESPVAILESLGIHALLKDAQQTELPDRSIDLIYSNFCLEHIPIPLQASLYKEFKRVASDGAVMSHYIGIADQYTSFDKSITPFNFLKYTSAQWRLLDNPMIPQTRLRASDYRRAIEQAGYSVVHEKHISGSLDDLRKIKLAPEFQGYSEEDLLILYPWFVARPVR